MRKWWNNVRYIEAFRNGILQPSKAVKFEEQLSKNPVLKTYVKSQQVSYEAISWYGRKKLKRRLKAINHRLLYKAAETDLYQEVRQIFKG